MAKFPSVHIKSSKRLVDNTQFPISAPVHKISICCYITEKFQAPFELDWGSELELKKVLNF